jgi:rsbT antagonist protein RsbS
LATVVRREGLGAQVVVSRVGKVVVVRLLGDLHGAALALFQEEVLGALRESATRGLVIDLAAVDLLDEFELEGLLGTRRMAELLGARTIVTGLQPALVASLVESSLPLGDLDAARTAEDAIALMESPRS